MPIFDEDIRYATFSAPGDGSTTQWEFNFAGAEGTPGYISKDHVKCFTTSPTGVRTEVVITEGMWVGPNTIEVSPAVPVGHTITIYRSTPVDKPLVNYTTTAIINEANLDKANRQAVYVAAEARDVYLDSHEDASDALANSIEALDKATTALATANGIDSKAQTALDNSAAAVVTADAAEATANAIAGTANTALANSAAAVSTANAASAAVTALSGPTGSNSIGFIQAGAGAVATTDQIKGRQVLSVQDFTGPPDGVTSNQAGIVAAVTEAIARDADLYWPGGPPFVATGNVPNFHSVNHIGPGKFLRAGTTFIINPGVDELNQIFVSPTGLATNDGLSSGFPKTPQSASDVMEGLGEKITRGRWRILFLAGTYRSGIVSTKMGRFTRYLELRGQSANIAAWQPSQAVAFGDTRVAFGGQLLYKCVAPGTTGVVEPTSRSGLVTDGTVIWSYIAGWAAWAPGQSISTNNYCKNAGKIYIAKSSGTTGATPPTHTTGAPSDGGVSWAFVGTELPLPTIEGIAVFDGSLNPPSWITGQLVQTGDARYRGTHCYRSRSVGNCGATPPTHTSGIVSDGTIDWEYIGERDLTVPTTAISMNPAPRVNPVWLKFNNFQNFESDAFASGLTLQGNTVHLMQWVQFANCFMGSYHHGKAEPYAQNCIFESCEEGMFVTYHVGATIGGPNSSDPSFFINCQDGVYMSRETVAHIDYCLFDRTRGDAVLVSIKSRFRSQGSHFLRNNICVWSIGGSEWGDTPGIDDAFYLQTPDANTIVAKNQSYGVWGDGSGFEHQYGDGELRYDNNWTPVTHTASGGDAGVTTLIRSFKRLPAKWFIDNGKKLRYVVKGNFTGTAGTKTVNCAIGANNVGGTGTLLSSVTGNFTLEVDVVPTALNVVNSTVRFQCGSTLIQSNNVGLAIFIIDPNGQDYGNGPRVYRNLAASGDSITIHSAEVFITG